MDETVYIKLEQNRIITQQDVFLGKIAEVWCKDKALMNRCKAVKIDKLPPKDGRYVYSVLDVIKKIQQEYPELEIQNLGEPDIVLEYKASPKGNKVWEWTKVIIISIIIFFGAAFAIMTFNNDVGVSEVFQKVYKLTTQEESGGFTIIEIMYSIGLGVGIMVFYNHFSKKKETSDPTPLEIEMKLYEQDMYTTMIKNAGRGNGKGDDHKCG